jgi:response regulator NasT
MRILLAEDESIIRMGLTSMLQELGHEVFAARDGREALTLARKLTVDLALLDIRMPHTSGLEAARVIGRNHAMPIIILTAYSDAALIEEAADLPISAYLIKPVDSAELNAAITVASKRFAEKQDLLLQRSRLAQSLEMRKLLDRAKGQLMARGMTEPEAYETLQRMARDSRRPLKEVVEELAGDRGGG